MNTEWEAEMAEIEEELAYDPREALPGLADLVEMVLDAHDVDLKHESADGDEADELTTSLLSALEVAEDVARGEDVASREIARAVESLRTVFRYALEASSAA